MIKLKKIITHFEKLLKIFFLSWLRPTLDESFTPNQNNRIMLVHWLIWLGAFTSLLYVFLNFWANYYRVALSNAIIFMLLLVGVWLGKKRYYTQQKIYGLLIANLGILITSLLHTYDSGAHALYLPIFCAPFVIFDFREKKRMLFFSSLALILAVFILLIKRTTLFGKEYEILTFNMTLNMFIALIITGFVFIIFIAINQNAEQQLLQREADLNTLIENANEAIWSLTKNYQLISYNKIFIKFCQSAYGRLPRKGMELLELTDDVEERNFWRSKYDRAMQKGRFVEEFPYTRYGFNRAYQVAFSPIYGQNDEVLGVSCYAKDITKRRRIEAENFENSQLLKAILQNVSIIVSTLDEKGNFKKVLGKGLERLRMKSEDFQGKNISDFPGYFPIGLLEELKMTKETVSFEAHGGKGENIWWMENFMFRTPKGEIVGCAIDITENKRNQEQLLEKNTMLEKTNKELDRFVYSTSHDLRAPLKSILGLIKLSKIDVQDTVAHQYFDMIRQNIEKLEDFIQEITEYSRNARQEVKLELIDFEALFSFVVHHHRYMENAEKLCFDVEVPPNIVFYSDASRLMIALNNLVSNAIKYHDYTKSNPFVRLKVVNHPHHVLIIVEDNGTGIQKEYQERVFDMFYRATEKSTGSGLGLYITKEIVDKLQGNLILSSEYMKGTTFTIRLPKMTPQPA